MMRSTKMPEQVHVSNSWRTASAWSLAVTLALRLGLGLVMASTWLAVRSFLPPTAPLDDTLYGELPIPATFPGDVLLGVWPRWDAVHHLNLAMRGYFDLSEGDTVFYPLYAILTRIAAQLTGGDYIIGGLIVSTLATFISFACLYRLTDSVFGPDSARWTVLALGAYPTSVFLIAPFTESLFLALTLGAFLAAYHRQWWAAGVLGFFASLTRGPGILTSAALAIIAWQQWRTMKPTPSRLQGLAMLLGLALPAAGGLAFLAWRSSVGFAPIPDILQRYSGLVLTDPLSGFVAAIAQWLRVHDFPTTLDILSAFLLIFLAGAMFARPRWRRPEWLVYAVVNVFVVLSKQSFTAASLQSISRYALGLFPVFIVIGDWLAHQRGRTRFVYLALSGASLLAISALYTLWVFVG